MTEKNTSLISYLSVTMATTPTDEIESTSEITSTWSYEIASYFQSAIIVIGIIGVTTNALILYAMVASNQHKKQMLIFNQNVFDLCSSLLLIITYALKLCNIYLTGTLGYWICMLILSDNLLWCSINGSVINLMSVTFERYLKVVHPGWSKTFLRNWVRGLAIAFAWIAGAVYNMTVAFLTSVVARGYCQGYLMWQSREAELANYVWNFITFSVVVVFIFIFCYGRILVVIRRQASVMAGHSGPGSSSTQTQSSQIQSNVINTMILVSGFYIVSCIPVHIFFLMIHVDTFTINPSHRYKVYFSLLFFSFLYICANPFIYAIKFDPVKRVLADLIPCKKSQQADAGVQTITS